MMAELRTRKREMSGDEGNYNEKVGLQRVSCASQFPIINTAGTIPDLVGNNNHMTPSNPNRVSHTPDISYLLVFPMSLSSSSPISLFVIHNSTIITEYKV